MKVGSWPVPVIRTVEICVLWITALHHTAERQPANWQNRAGDARVSANINQDIHLKPKIAAAKERTTIGELIERLVQENLV